MFQSQTGSQALSDDFLPLAAQDREDVSIPNGKPGPLRLYLAPGIQAQITAFQSQTGSQALSDTVRFDGQVMLT